MWQARGVIQVRMGVLMDYPEGLSDRFEYCTREGDQTSEWQSLLLEGTWFPDAFIGTMASLQCYQEGSTRVLPTCVEDAYRTMAVVEAAYQSSDSGGIPIPD